MPHTPQVSNGRLFEGGYGWTCLWEGVRKEGCDLNYGCLFKTRKTVVTIVLEVENGNQSC